MTPPEKRRPLDLQQRSRLAGEASAASSEVERARAAPEDPTAAAGKASGFEQALAGVLDRQDGVA